MTRYTPQVLVSAGLLAIAVSAQVLLFWRGFIDYFPYFMWLHVAIIAQLSYGSWVLKRPANKTQPGGASFFLRGLPSWLVVLAIPVALAAAPLVPMYRDLLDPSPDGQFVSSRSWSEKEGRYYLTLNRTTTVEISRDEYLDEMRQGFRLFASIWIVFSYGALVLWQYIWRRHHLVQNG